MKNIIIVFENVDRRFRIKSKKALFEYHNIVKNHGKVVSIYDNKDINKMPLYDIRIKDTLDCDSQCFIMETNDDVLINLKLFPDQYYSRSVKIKYIYENLDLYLIENEMKKLYELRSFENTLLTSRLMDYSVYDAHIAKRETLKHIFNEEEQKITNNINKELYQILETVKKHQDVITNKKNIVYENIKKELERKQIF